MVVAAETSIMAADSDPNTSKVAVQTYLPEYQRDEWDAHAEELDMSRSEFVKAMVQAGRRGFEGETRPESEPAVSAPSEQSPEAGGTGSLPGASLEETVIDELADEEYLSWEDLLAAVTDDVESRLEATLQELQSSGKVRYSGRHGGYTLDS